MATKKTIKTQGDFDKQMNTWQEELRDIMLPIHTREDELRVELCQLHVKKTELHKQMHQQKEHWMQICEQENIREEKLACLAEGRQLKALITQVWAEIGTRKLEMSQLRQKRRQLTQPYHDKMHELIVKYPKGSLPLVAR